MSRQAGKVSRYLKVIARHTLRTADFGWLTTKINSTCPSGYYIDLPYVQSTYTQEGLLGLIYTVLSLHSTTYFCVVLCIVCFASSLYCVCVSKCVLFHWYRVATQLHLTNVSCQTHVE